MSSASSLLQSEVYCLCLCDSKNGQQGEVVFEKLADPKSVVVTWCGEKVMPIGFTIYGEPIFSSVFVRKYLQDIGSKAATVKDLKISYQVVDFNVAEESINTIDALQKSLISFDDFCDFVQKRLKYARLYNSKNLKSFVINNRYVLDSKGNVCLIADSMNDAPLKDAYFLEEFQKYNVDGRLYYLPIPFSTTQRVCSKCNVKFTIVDFLSENILYSNLDAVHVHCNKENKEK